MSTTALRFLQQENTRLKEENNTLREENLALRRYMDALKELYKAAQQIISEENLLQLLDHILYNAMSVVGAQDGSLLILDEETDELVFVLVHGDVRPELQGYRIARNVGIAGSVATQREPLIVNNPRQDRRFSVEIDETFGFITHSILCVPMIAGGNLVGVIELVNKRDGGEFTEADTSLLSILGYVAAIALDEMRSRLEAEEEVKSPA
jgi:GAF domain-containing protein